MTKFGEVLQYDGRSGVAVIRYTRPEACAKCGACGGSGKEMVIRLKTGETCRPGNWVKVELPDGRFLHAAALAYAVPLALFLAGLFAGYRWLGGEGAAILTGLLGLLLGMGFLRFKDRALAGRPEWTPRVTAVYEDRSAVDALGCPGRE